MSIQYQGLVTHGLASQIADKIKQAILEGALKVDERLPTEEELAQRFAVSRPTIREALKRLAAQNLIRSRRGPTGGTFVNQPTQAETRLMMAYATALLVSMGELSLADIAETRQELESLCCRLAAKRRTDEQLQLMAEEINRQRDPNLSDQDFCASDVRFHRTLIAAAHNVALDLASAGVIEALQPAINLMVFRFRDRTQVANQHAAIHAALTAHDAKAALAALTQYMDALTTQYQAAQAASEKANTTRTPTLNVIDRKAARTTRRP
jgi:DNA-binding FadR family transcriptional regulator